MKLPRLLSRKSAPKSVKGFNKYDTLDKLPLFNWDRLHTTGDLRYLIISENPEEIEGADPKELNNLWTLLQQEYIDEFGLSEEYLTILRTKKQSILLKIKAALTGDGSRNALAKIKDEELKERLERKEKVTFNDTLAQVEKFMGYQINPKQISVKKFYTYLKLMSKGSK